MATCVKTDQLKKDKKKRFLMIGKVLTQNCIDISRINIDQSWASYIEKSLENEIQLSQVTPSTAAVAAQIHLEILHCMPSLFAKQGNCRSVAYR